MAFAATTFAASAQMQPLPVDKGVRIGKLDNGLTYYIRHNEEPKGQAAFVIAHKVGAVQEEDNQRGLAHFLEHMAFNGSEHFPAGSVFPFINRIGCTRFNAETGVDQTWYHLDNVPTANPLIVDSCMMLLSDWSGRVTLSEEEIEQERDVIHGEYRMGDNASMRMLTRQLKNLYPGSRYADRMPIGVMEVIDNFSPDFLRDYYHKWYHPDLQAVIVVGDIDVDYIENKIVELFSDLGRAENAADYEYYEVPDNEKAIVLVDKDKEMQMANIDILFKHAIMPFDMRNSVNYKVLDYMSFVAVGALNQRLSEAALKADCPFVVAQVRDGDYVYSKTCGALSLTVVPKPGRDLEAVECAMTEIARAKQHGLTAGEIDRLREVFLSSAESLYDERNKLTNDYYMHQYKDNFLSGEPIPDVETYYELMKQIAQVLPAEQFGVLLQQYLASNEHNFVMLACYPDNETVTIPTAEQLKAAADAGFNAQTEGYVDETNNEPFIANLPKPIKAKKVSAAAYDFTKLTLSNGANVYYRKTDFSDNNIQFAAVSHGGFNKVSDAEAVWSHKFINPQTGRGYSLFELVMESTGVYNFTANDLSKKLAGKNINITVSLGDFSDMVEGSSTIKDLRTFFEVVNVGFQGPTNDPDGYNNLVGQLQSVLPQFNARHELIQIDSLYNTNFGHSNRRQLIHSADLEGLDYQQFRKIYSERFKSAGDFDFFFVGPFNEDTLKAYVEQYIATLPGLKQRETITDLGINPAKGENSNFYKIAMPSADAAESRITVAWHFDAPYNVEQVVANNALGRILGERYFKKIREEGSMGYSAGASGNANFVGIQRYAIQAQTAVKPEKQQPALDIIYAEMADIAKNGVSADELKNFREPQLTKYDELLRTDDFWMSLIQDIAVYGIDTHNGKLEALKSLTSAQVQAIAQEYMKQNNRLTVVMLPE